MKKKIKDLILEEKEKICKVNSCGSGCPLNFKNNKEYCFGYFACWYDMEEEHINYVKEKFNNADKELEEIYKEENSEKELDLDYEFHWKYNQEIEVEDDE